MEGPPVAWAVVCSLFHRKQAFELTGQLLSMGCECCPGAPSPFLQTTAERSGLRKASWALTHAWTVTIVGPSVTAPTWAPCYGTFCSFLSLWGRIRLTQKRCLLISGWSYIFVWNSKTFLNVVHLLNKNKNIQWAFPQRSRTQASCFYLWSASNIIQVFKAWRLNNRVWF